MEPRRRGSIINIASIAGLGVATETQRNSLYQQIPLGRLGEPSEYAALAVFLARDDHYLVGQVISPDGGAVIGA
jgi:3-oxoacyl-[acyl-carrier protein] reductase